MRYIIHTNGNGAEIDIPAGASSDDYGLIHEAFAARYGAPGDRCANIVKRYADQVIGEVFYNWGLAGPDGAWYEVFQWPENSKQDVTAAVNKLRREQDVVRLHVTKLKRVAYEIPQEISARLNA